MVEHLILPQPGDIALIFGQGIKSWALAALQRTARWGKYENKGVSHVLLCIAEDVWIQATPPTVDFVLGREVFGPGVQLRSWEVIRRKSLVANSPSSLNSWEALDWVDREAARYKQWLEACLSFLGQKYNYAYAMPKIRTMDRSCFCSELVAKVYEECGMPLGIPTQIFPMDLADLLVKDPVGWEKITEGYRRYLEHGTKDELAAESKRGKDTIEMYRTIFALRLTTAEQYADRLFHSAQTKSTVHELNLLPSYKLLHELQAIEKELSLLSPISWILRPSIQKRLKRVERLRKQIMVGPK